MLNIIIEILREPTFYAVLIVGGLLIYSSPVTGKGPQ